MCSQYSTPGELVDSVFCGWPSSNSLQSDGFMVNLYNWLSSRTWHLSYALFKHTNGRFLKICAVFSTPDFSSNLVLMWLSNPVSKLTQYLPKSRWWENVAEYHKNGWFSSYSCHQIRLDNTRPTSYFGKSSYYIKQVHEWNHSPSCENDWCQTLGFFIFFLKVALALAELFSGRSEFIFRPPSSIQQ